MAVSSDRTDLEPSAAGAPRAAGDAPSKPEGDFSAHDAHPGENGRISARPAGTLAPATPRGEATRRRIIDAAEVVFGEQGYHGASIAEITRRAGVAQGTFYIYFHSKREIFIELVEHIGHQLRQAMRAGTVGATNRLEAERGGFAAFFNFVAGHPRIYYIVEEARRVAPEAAEAYYRRIVAGYERGLRAAMDAGEIRRADAEAVAYALMGIGHFVALRWLIWPRRDGYTHETQSSALTDRDGSIATQLPEGILSAVIELITHGLAPSSEAQDSSSPESARPEPPQPQL